MNDNKAVLIDLDALEHAALLVGREQWFKDGTGTIYLCETDPVDGPVEQGMEVAEVYLRSDNKDWARQKFIAAANPSVVLELIRRLEVAEKQRERLLLALKGLLADFSKDEFDPKCVCYELFFDTKELFECFDAIAFSEGGAA